MGLGPKHFQPLFPKVQTTLTQYLLRWSFAEHQVKSYYELKRFCMHLAGISWQCVIWERECVHVEEAKQIQGVAQDPEDGVAMEEAGLYGHHYCVAPGHSHHHPSPHLHQIPTWQERPPAHQHKVYIIRIVQAWTTFCIDVYLFSANTDWNVWQII